MDRMAIVTEPLSRDDCLELLQRVKVGRLGSIIDALPVVLPVRFVMFSGAIVFRLAPGTKLANTTIGAVVALQADDVDGTGRAAWSVLVQGTADEITDPARLSAVRNLPLGPWAPNGRYVALDPTIVSGRRFTS
jgi:nitroimidazol reductase NimA-like FMN-containing flavoprotein (pyridoxamine 5'-phosphate oxidase superfamily)